MQKAEDKMNREYKDSVFVDLFRDKKYLLDLYQHLHPEDTGVTEDELGNITISNVLAKKIHNDFRRDFLTVKKYLWIWKQQS